MEENSDLTIVVLAAGLGKRMQSELPKVLHKIAGKPLVGYTLETAKSLEPGQIITVVKYKKELVSVFAKQYSGIAEQGHLYGTAKALQAALPFLTDASEHILVLNGDDSMFYSNQTLLAMIDAHKQSGANVTFLTVVKQNPTGLGRIVYNADGSLAGIIEEKDASDKQRLINEVNAGVYLLQRPFIETFIGLIQPSPVTGEYYLTDVIAHALANGRLVVPYKLRLAEEFYGVNNTDELAVADRLMRQKISKKPGARLPQR